MAVRAQAVEKEEAATGTSEAWRKPAASKKDGEIDPIAATAAVSSALEKAEKAEWALRNQAGWLVRNNTVSVVPTL